MLKFPEENGVTYGGEKYLQHKMDEYMDSSISPLTKSVTKEPRNVRKRE